MSPPPATFPTSDPLARLKARRGRRGVIFTGLSNQASTGSGCALGLDLQYSKSCFTNKESVPVLVLRAPPSDTTSAERRFFAGPIGSSFGAFYSLVFCPFIRRLHKPKPFETNTVSTIKNDQPENRAGFCFEVVQDCTLLV
jgi:hypothetical protein